MVPGLKEEYMSPKEFEKEFGISVGAQARYRMRKYKDDRTRSIPFYKIFGRVYYRRDEIAEWLKSNKQN